MSMTENLKQLWVSSIDALKATHHHWYILIGLLLLSILGVAITDASERISHWYWLAMVPVFFSACLLVEWDATKASGLSARAVIIKQVMHWFGLLVGVYLTFHLRNIGSLDNQTTGLILLMLFAISSFLAGVTMGWLFRLLGAFLAISLYLVAYLEHYLQVVLWIALGVLFVYYFIVKHLGYDDNKA